MTVKEQAAGSRSREGLTDEQLAVRASEGVPAAYEELASRYTSRLFRFLGRRMMTAQDAEDLTQETLIRAFENIGGYDSRWRFSTWIYTIASRLALNYNRNRHREAGGLSLGDAPVSDSALWIPETPLTSLSQSEDFRNLWTTARQLKTGQYEALWLRYVEDLTVNEIAEVLKKTKLHVRVLLHRARSNLSALMQQTPSTAFAGATENIRGNTGNPVSREERNDVLLST